MNTEKTTAAAAVLDEDLDKVTGGCSVYHDPVADVYYGWTGDDESGSKYLCPNCKRPVHYGSWLRFYCDPCDASWYNYDNLLPNLASDEWKQISKGEYQVRRKGGGYR